jgi:hypothetical protein
MNFSKTYKHYNFRVTVFLNSEAQMSFINAKIDQICDFMIEQGYYGHYEYKGEKYSIDVLMQR